MINLLNSCINYSLFKIYDKEYFIRNLIIPIYEDSINLQVAVCKESNLQTIKDDFSKIIKFKETTKDEILFCLANLDTKIELYELCLAFLLNIDNQHKIETILKEILNFAIKQRASDIHIENFTETILFRFRVDGKLKTFFTFKKKFFSSISSYIKLISNLDITQIRIPMDGRFSFFIDDKKYDFRVSTMPTLDSESIVLRILDNKNIQKNLYELGFSKNILTIIENSLKLTQGLILITGPTGSGKTTTLYSILKKLNSNEKKIITVEDPVEYKIDSISQISINPKIGLGFDVVLKNVLRQDPDIILIGEIRDKFSLDIALQASLTGHLVIASIHANSALETISRLIDLQADPFLISSSLKLILAQRLVLKYCKFCNNKGCIKCNFTKYYDRTTIAETILIDEKISSLIFKKSSLEEFKDYLKTINYKNLLDDGLEKVSQNITSKEEVFKVIYS